VGMGMNIMKVGRDRGVGMRIKGEEDGLTLASRVLYQPNHSHEAIAGIDCNILQATVSKFQEINMNSCPKVC
jgi:hypothetical protein